MGQIQQMWRFNWNWTRKTGKTISCQQGLGRAIYFESSLITFQSINPLVMKEVCDEMDGTVNYCILISCIADMRGKLAPNRHGSIL